MFLTQVVEQYVDKPVVALDLCASPGGKSTLLRAALPEGSLLVSNEPIRPRAQVLSENITKWGHPLCIVTNNYPADFSKFVHLFDLIVADVPCSGEGMFRKDEVAVSDWSTAKVAECESLQRSIINDIWRCLKPGGLLVYSTCTYNALEDEGNVEWIVKNLGAEVLKVETKPEWNIKGNTVGTPYDVYHFMPHITKGEGFFLCLMRKPLDAEDDIPEEAPQQLDLFTDYEALARQKEKEAAADAKEKRLQEAALDIQERFGKNAMLKGMNLEEGAMTIKRNGQVGGHRA